MSSIGGQRSPIILAASNTAVSLTGSTSETTLVTVTIPANLMGANGTLRVTALWNVTNSGNSKTAKVRLGGIGGTAYLDTSVTTVVGVQTQQIIRNNNSTSAQKGYAGTAPFGSTSGANTTSVIDTTASTTLVFTGTLANSGETMSLEGYSVEFIPGV